MRKKATEYSLWLVFITAVLVFTVIIMLWAKFSIYDEKVGTTQFSLMDAYEKAEVIQNYIDFSSKLAFMEALYDGTTTGFLYGNSCSVNDEYYGYKRLNTPFNSCVPNFKLNLAFVTNQLLSSYLGKYKEELPALQYLYYFLDEDNGFTLFGRPKKGLKIELDEDLTISENNIEFSSEQVGGGYATSNPLGLIRPVGASAISSCFEDRSVYCPSCNQYHHGIDFSINAGTDVKAIDGGVVVYTGSGGTDSSTQNWASYGTRLIIEHDFHGIKYYTLYGHLKEILVEEGDTVRQGQLIAKSDNTGASGPGSGGGNHLHLELRAIENRWDNAINLLCLDSEYLDGYAIWNDNYCKPNPCDWKNNKVWNEFKSQIQEVEHLDEDIRYRNLVEGNVITGLAINVPEGDNYENYEFEDFELNDGESYRIIEDYSNGKTCQEQNGIECNITESCTGYFVPANDVGFCCTNGECVEEKIEEEKTPTSIEPIEDSKIQTNNLRFIIVIFILIIILGYYIIKKKNIISLSLFGLIVLSLIFIPAPSHNQITGKATLDSGVYCANADYSLLGESVLSNCAVPDQSSGKDKMSLIQKYLEKYNMVGYDPLLVAAQFHVESGCNHPASNGQGIGQVVSCAENGVSICDIETNIDRAIGGHLKPSLERMEQNGITDPIEKIKLVQFEYNRGGGSANVAIEYYLNEGYSLDDAMREACYYYFDQGAYYGCGGLNREQCCDTRGGRQYPYTVLDRYESACSQIGGQLTQDIPDSVPEPDERVTEEDLETLRQAFEESEYGFYLIEPSVNLDFDYNILKIHDELSFASSILIDEVLDCAFYNYACVGEVEDFSCIDENYIERSCERVGQTLLCQDPLDEFVQYTHECKMVFNQPVCENQDQRKQFCREDGQVLSCRDYTVTYKECAEQVLQENGKTKWNLDYCINNFNEKSCYGAGNVWDGTQCIEKPNDYDTSQTLKFCIDTDITVFRYAYNDNAYKTFPADLKFALTMHSGGSHVLPELAVDNPNQLIPGEGAAGSSEFDDYGCGLPAGLWSQDQVPETVEFTAEVEHRIVPVPVHPSILDTLLTFQREAKKRGYDIVVSHGYRSYDLQKRLYDACQVTLASGGSCIVAPPGQSQHQTGHAVDIYIYDAEADARGDFPYKAISPLFDLANELGMLHQFPSDTPHFCIP